MTNNLTIGATVYSPDHPNSIGTVTRLNEAGDATIQFVTPPSDRLPFGHSLLEFWPVSDQHILTTMESR